MVVNRGSIARNGERAGGGPTRGWHEFEFSVVGMTCGSCAARIERTLSREGGVERAAVNLATESAVVAPGPIGIDDLIAAVGRIGYGLAVRCRQALRPGRELQALCWRRLLVAWPLGLPVLVLSRDGEGEHHGHEDARDPVGEALDGDLGAWASSTRRTIWARAVSPPTAVAWTVRTP
jgi:copper chaperone CopZ